MKRLMDDGRMGQVYEAEDTRSQQSVALKLISPESVADAMFRARVHREGQTSTAKSHLVPIHDYGDIGGQFYVATRVIGGTSLRALLTDYGALSPAGAVAVLRQIAAALDVEHANGVTCHDVRPENIVVNPDNVAHLMDFGVADAITDPTPAQGSAAVGTYNYLAPEWFTGDQVTSRADIYALACVLSECLTGAPPYQADSVEQLIAAQRRAPIHRPGQLRPEWVSPALDSVVVKSMAQDPAGRYHSAGELALAAHRALTASEQHEVATIARQGGNENLFIDPVAAHLEAEAITSATEPPGAGTAAHQVRDSADTSPAQSVHPGPDPEELRPSAAVESPAADNAGWASAPWAEFDLGEAMRSQGPSIFDPANLTTTPHHKRKFLLILGGAAVIVVVVSVVAGLLISRLSSHPYQASPVRQMTAQTVLPFNGLNFRLSPGGVTVDDAGTVYVTNQSLYGRVVALPAGSGAPTVEPFRILYEPQAVAVDSTGALYVTDFNNRVVMLAAGSNSQIELPFANLSYPEGITVDSQGSVYVADRGNNRVVKLAAGSESQTELPFRGLRSPDGVAVDQVGNVYVTDTDNSRVLRLDAASNNQTVLPFPRLSRPWGIAVDRAGDVFVTEHDTNSVVKLAAGSPVPTVLPFSGLNAPLSVAVDNSGNVYVANRGDDTVLKLAPQK